MFSTYDAFAMFWGFMALATFLSYRVGGVYVCVHLYNTHANLISLSIVKRHPVHFILNQWYVEYVLGVLMLENSPVYLRIETTTPYMQSQNVF